jgi:putative glutamine amidotransferase
MRPLIGIPPCLDDRDRWRAGSAYHYIDAAYARAVEQAGGTPVYLPQTGSADAVVVRLDGLLMPGGDDLVPDRPYPAEVCFDPVPDEQLAFDRALLAAALRRDLPVLAICYGMQLLALASGGTLHYDLATDLPSANEHKPDDPDARHPLRMVRGSLLAKLLGDAPDSVNTRHHQAVDEPGEALVTATADDGVVEAIELDAARFAIGVQWHPERLDGAHRDRLFGGFVEACRG